MIRYLLLLSLALISLNGKDAYYYQNSKKIYISPIKQIKNFSLKSVSSPSTIIYFKTMQNNILGMNNEILIKTNIDIKIVLKKYNISLVNQITKNIYLLKTIDNSNVLDVANSLYEDDDIEFSHPNFTKKIQTR